MKKEKPQPRYLPVDLLAVIDDFTGMVEKVDFSDMSEVSDEVIARLEKQVEELRKNVDFFARMTEDLYKAANLTKEDKARLAADAAKNGPDDVKEYSKRLQKSKQTNARAQQHIGEALKAHGEETSPAPAAEPASELDPKEMAKKRKTLRGKKNWMPL